MTLAAGSWSMIGQGAILGNAEAELRAFLDRSGMPAASTLLGLSALPSDDPRNVGMLGMHGNYGPNIRNQECDLLIAVGCRFSDRVATSPKTFAKQAKIVQIDIDRSEIDKNVQTDHHIIGDACRVLELLNKITDGKGTMEDLDTLRDLADMIENTALCGLGKSAPKPVISTLNAFRDEYVAHIRDRRCPAGVCSKLRVYSIDPAKCKGCSKCARNCPASAIHGTLKSPYTIDQDACIRCGSCVEQCAFGAITVEK